MKAQVRHFKKMMALFTRHNLQGHRHRWCYEFSKQRTESTRELEDIEVLAIINAIEAHFKTQDKADVMRKKIIALAHQMRWELPEGAIDMARIEDFSKTYGYLKKPLNSYTLEELPLLVTQFERANHHFVKSI